MKNLHPLLYGTLVLALVGIAITFTACEKNYSSDILDLSERSTSQTNFSEDFYSLNPKKIGEKHNEILHSIHEEMNNSNSFNLKNAVQNLDINLNFEQRVEILNWAVANNEEENHKIICDNLTSSNSLNLYYEILNAIETSENYDILNVQVSNLLESVNEKVTNETDKKIINIFGYTCLASAKYWMIEYDGNIEGKPAEWVKSDGRGAKGTSITWAVGAALASGPVAPLTYFVSVGLGAALASIMASDSTTTTTGY
jgi:hypothetical protein